jgi:hypothetical protein
VFVALCAATRLAAAQVPSEGLTGARINAVRVELAPPPPDPQAARNLEGAVRRAFRVFPGDRFDQTRVDFGVSRARGVAGVSDVRVSVEFAEVGGVELVVQVFTGPPPPPSFATRVRFVDDGEKLLKAMVAVKGAIPVSGNQWFGNGPTLTEFNPYGRFTGGNGPNTAYDLSPKLGLAGTVPVIRGETPLYAYGHVGYLMAGIAGQANGTPDSKYSGGWEEAYAGVVGGGATSSGTQWAYNVSYGLQSYCIGGAMLLCQVAGSSGDRAGDFTWPRWSGRNFLKAQFRVNHTTVDGFHFEPNDFPRSRTRIAGINAQHDPGYGTVVGVTWLTVLASDSLYYLPTGATLPRDGMRALQLRAGYTPAPGRPGPVGKAEWARQTNANFDMSAIGAGLEGGWSFARAKWAPTVTYRWTTLGGDDAGTETFERWDLFYSGGDVDTWVQGQLMKNVHYNSNVRMQRVLGRLRLGPTWRFMGSFSDFRANELNNLGGVVSVLADEAVGRELLFVSEHTLSRAVYVRLTQGTLWPGAGVRGTLPAAVASPWLVGVVSLNIQY